MPKGKCALCLENRELRRSHAIPDSLFKRISRKNNGQSISFSDDNNSSVGYSSDSWWDYQLCENCEKHLNINYEQYSISAIRGSKGIFKKHDLGVTFKEVDTLTLQLFFLSIFWRAAKSKNPAYQKIDISDYCADYIQTHLLNKTRVPLPAITVKISRLIDRTAQDKFSLETLKDLIVSPFCRQISEKKLSFCFVLEGFFVEFFVPGQALKHRTTLGVVNPSKNIIVAPYLNVFDVPELMQLLLAGYRKNQEGKVNVATYHPSKRALRAE